MRSTNFLCDLFHQHKWTILREEWLEPKGEEIFPCHLQFLRCVHCTRTQAILTHPEAYKNLHSQPSPFYHSAKEPHPFFAGG